MSHPPLNPKKRENVEVIGLRAIVYGRAARTIFICAVLAWAIIHYSLLPNLLYRIIALACLLAVVLILVPNSVRQVFGEMRRRSGG